MQTGAATTENSLKAPQDVKIGTLFGPAIPPLGIYPKETKSAHQRDICTPTFISASFTVQVWKRPERPPTDEWTEKMGVYVTWKITQPRTEPGPDICSDAEGP